MEHIYYMAETATSLNHMYKMPALISQHDEESADLRGLLACNLLPAIRVPAKNTEGAIPTWYSEILASVIDEDSKRPLIREK